MGRGVRYYPAGTSEGVSGGRGARAPDGATGHGRDAIVMEEGQCQSYPT